MAGTTSWSFLGPAVPHMARLVLVLSLSGHSGSGVLFSAVLREAGGAAGVLARALLLGALRLCSLATPLGGQPRQRWVLLCGHYAHAWSAHLEMVLLGHRDT